MNLQRPETPEHQSGHQHLPAWTPKAESRATSPEFPYAFWQNPTVPREIPWRKPAMSFRAAPAPGTTPQQNHGACHRHWLGKPTWKAQHTPYKHITHALLHESYQDIWNNFMTVNLTFFINKFLEKFNFPKVTQGESVVIVYKHGISSKNIPVKKRLDWVSGKSKH